MPIPDEFIYSQTSDDDGSFNFFQDKKQEEIYSEDLDNNVDPYSSNHDQQPCKKPVVKNDIILQSAFAMWMTTKAPFLKKWFKGF